MLLPSLVRQEIPHPVLDTRAPWKASTLDPDRTQHQVPVAERGEADLASMTHPQNHSRNRWIGTVSVAGDHRESAPEPAALEALGVERRETGEAFSIGGGRLREEPLGELRITEHDRRDLDLVHAVEPPAVLVIRRSRLSRINRVGTEAESVRLRRRQLMEPTRPSELRFGLSDGRTGGSASTKRFPVEQMQP